MISTPELLEKLRSDLENIKNEHDAEKLRAWIDQFVDKYDVWPDLQNVKQKIATQKKEYYEKLRELEKKADEEIEQTFSLIKTKCAKNNIDIPRALLLPYDQKVLVIGEELESLYWHSIKADCEQKGRRVPKKLPLKYKKLVKEGIERTQYTSEKPVARRFHAVEKILYFLFEQGHKKLVSSFVIISTRGCIEPPSFSHTFLEWDKLRNNHKLSIWHSFQNLIEYANEGKPFAEKKQLTTPEECCKYFQNIMLSVGQPVNKQTLKQQAAHVYEYTKNMLLLDSNNQDISPQNNSKDIRSAVENEKRIFYYQYEDDLRKGTLTEGSKESPLKGNSAALIDMLLRKKKEILIIDATEEMANSDQLDIDRRQDQVYSARRIVNTRVLKDLNAKNFIQQYDGAVCINPKYIVKRQPDKTNS